MTRKARKRVSPPAKPRDLDPTSPMPLYHQIFLRLRDSIYAGEYEVDSFLPSEQELAASYQVSRITAKRVLDELAAAGLAMREQGRGTRVCITPRSMSLRGSVDGFVHSLHAKASSSVQLLDFDYVSAPSHVADKLRLTPGDEVQRARRVWSGAAGAFNHLTTFVPAELGRRWSRQELERKPLVALLEASGVKIERVEENITATLADAHSAAALAVAQKSPLLKIARTIYDQDERPVEYLIALYPPERYQYTVTLARRDYADAIGEVL